MIKGMTGFGSAEVFAGKVKGFVEIKSQNHRYVDIVYSLPAGFSSIESKIKKLLGKEIQRGRLSVSVKITEKPIQTLTLNKNVIKQYLRQAKDLKKEYGLANDLTMADLIHLPGVVETKETPLYADKLWPEIEKGLRFSLVSLLNMRKREGMALCRDSSDILKRMILQLKKIQARTKVLAKKRKKELSEEALAQKNYDINEEIVRLKHYIDEYKLLLRSQISVGKKLDFIAQEMQRETNTIGSKVQDKIVSNAVIALKSKVEKLREQAQNIE